MKIETLKLVKQLQELSEQNVTVVNTITINETTNYESFKLVFWDIKKEFVDNLKQRRVYKTEAELQAEIESIIFNLS